MSAPIYRLDNLTQRYGTREVLHIPTLTIDAGELLALVGPSGAGKSTLLRMLNFLESPATGTITFRGNAIGNAEAAPLAARRAVTTVFQRPAVLSGSVLHNVAYGLRLRHAADARRAALTVLERLGLAHLATAAARSLSGGELQRLALARALVLRPAVLLLDEPTAQLDPRNVALIEAVVSELHRDHGAAIVFVTHNIFQARRLAQRVALLIDGSLVEVAPTERFFAAPQDERTAAFVSGTMIY